MFFKEKLNGDNRRAKSSRHFFHTFWHFSTHFHTFQSFFFRSFPPGLFLRMKGFYCCFSSKRRKENKKRIKRERKDHFARWLSHVCPPPSFIESYRQSCQFPGESLHSPCKIDKHLLNLFPWHFTNKSITIAHKKITEFRVCQMPL